MEKAGDEDKVITYTDVVGALMSSVTDIVDTISYVLVAFVAISLVVSSIMIGVITCNTQRAGAKKGNRYSPGYRSVQEQYFSGVQRRNRHHQDCAPDSSV